MVKASPQNSHYKVWVMVGYSIVCCVDLAPITREQNR